MSTEGPDHHNEGQKDGAENSWRPPHQQSVFGELAFGYNQKELDDRADYGIGWENGYKNR